VKRNFNALTIFNEPPYWIEKTEYGMWLVGFNDGEWWEIGCVATLKMARNVIREHSEKRVSNWRQK
jgi:hypothetical protein